MRHFGPQRPTLEAKVAETTVGSLKASLSVPSFADLEQYLEIYLTIS